VQTRMPKEDLIDDDRIYKQLIDEVDKYAKKMGQPMRGYGHTYPSAMTPAAEVDQNRI